MFLRTPWEKHCFFVWRCSSKAVLPPTPWLGTLGKMDPLESKEWFPETASLKLNSSIYSCFWWTLSKFPLCKEQLKAIPFDPNSDSILAVAPVPRPMPKKGRIRNKWAIKLDLDNDEGFSDMCLSKRFFLSLGRKVLDMLGQLGLSILPYGIGSDLLPD